MFRNSSQLAQVCRAVLAHGHLQHLWWEGGPTPQALQALEEEGSPLSKRERTLVLLAWALWSGHEQLSVSTLLRTLNGELLFIYAQLLEAVALGPEAVDAWLEEHETERRLHA